MNKTLITGKLEQHRKADQEKIMDLLSYRIKNKTEEDEESKQAENEADEQLSQSDPERLISSQIKMFEKFQGIFAISPNKNENQYEITN